MAKGAAAPLAGDGGCGTVRDRGNTVLIENKKDAMSLSDNLGSKLTTMDEGGVDAAIARGEQVMRFEPADDADRLPLAEVKALTEAVRARYVELRREDDEATDKDLRKRLADADPAWASFAQGMYALFFEKVTTRTTTEAEVAGIGELFRLQVEVEEGKVTMEAMARRLMRRGPPQ